MPRNLTDLFESAVSTAPPELHDARDITRLAERSQRRRTTAFVAAGASLAVVAAVGLGYGLTHGRATTPEPAGPAYRYGQELDVKDAVAASSLPGFQVLPWTQPSVANFGPGRISLPTYLSLDASGRLLVGTYQGGDTTVIRFDTARLYDAPGRPASPLRAPASSGRLGGWEPAFTGDGRLWWFPTVNEGPPTGVNPIHVTDLSGGHDVSVPVGSVNEGVKPWVTGDHVWYEQQQGATLEGGETRRLYVEPLVAGAHARLVASDVLAAHVADGMAAWVTTDGRVHVAQADGSGVREVHVPLDPGCTLTSAPEMSLVQAIAVSRDVVALSELCGTGATAFDDLLAFDTSGRLLVHVKGFSVRAVSLSGSLLAVGGVDDRRRFENLVYDLRTGALATFGRFAGRLYDGSPELAGRYLLWYDTSGHVGEFTG
jgi:hypothetical protein